MSLAAKLMLVVLSCMVGVVLIWLAQLLAKEPVTWLRDLLSAVVVVGLLSCLLAVAALVLG